MTSTHKCHNVFFSFLVRLIDLVDPDVDRLDIDCYLPQGQKVTFPCQLGCIWLHYNNAVVEYYVVSALVMLLVYFCYLLHTDLCTLFI